jgi:hypothetical protein
MAQELQAAAAIATASFGDRVADAVERKRSQIVVGLDPVVDLLPVELRGDAQLGSDAAADAVARFCCGIVDAVAPEAVGVKPQLAFFEALGAPGFRVLDEICLYARAAGLLVIVDGKRGDIGSTARAYAAAYLEPRAGAAPRGVPRDVPRGVPRDVRRVAGIEVDVEDRSVRRRLARGAQEDEAELDTTGCESTADTDPDDTESEPSPARAGGAP